MKFYFSHARTALKYGIKSLNLDSNSEIFLPKFICQVMLYPLLENNIKIIFYDIEDDFSVDFQKLKKKVTSNSKAFIGVNYFGHFQDYNKVIKFCDEYNLIFIEDNSHSYMGKFNNTHTGSLGDISISSPRKFININCGGILQINNKSKLDLPVIPKYPIKNKLIVKEYLKSFPTIINLLKKYLVKKTDYLDPYNNFEEEIPDYLIDDISLNQINQTDWNKLINERRNNYRIWSNWSQKNEIETVFPSLQIGENPWCFVGYVKSKSLKKKILNWGIKNNYFIFTWPTLPKQFINEKSNPYEIWKKIICFSTNNYFTKNEPKNL